ncbi:MAG TPA: ATP-binding protein [Nitrospira sp.]|nr:ATP-binding protein [Nitrospira sp.]
MTLHAAPAAPDASLLHEAFRTFGGAAATLQRSYRALTDRLEQLDLELADRNEALRRNLKANEELREHLTAILESLSTGVLVTDDRGTVTRCNEAGEQLLGMPRERLLGRALDECLREAALDGDGYPLTTKTGAMATVSRRALHNPDGRACGSVTLVQDVTTLHQLEERLQRRDRLAAMGEMVARIAHEIRNPLGSIELFASMLRRDLSHEAGPRTYAEHISSAVQLLDRLLSNLLVYTKPDCPQTAWHETEALIVDTLTLAAHTIAGQHLDIRLKVDPAASRLWCDAGQMKQALLNLIVNAIQAMPDGGTLTICAEQGGGDGSRTPHVHLAVADTGIGISPAQRERIFDPFFTTKDEGTGLGLAIVHAIVEAHRGRIDVDSVAGRGTTFTIVLPSATEPSETCTTSGDSVKEM